MWNIDLEELEELEELEAAERASPAAGLAALPVLLRDLRSRQEAADLSPISLSTSPKAQQTKSGGEDVLSDLLARLVASEEARALADDRLRELEKLVVSQEERLKAQEHRFSAMVAEMEGRFASQLADEQRTRDAAILKQITKVFGDTCQMFDYAEKDTKTKFAKTSRDIEALTEKLTQVQTAIASKLEAAAVQPVSEAEAQLKETEVLPQQASGGPTKAQMQASAPGSALLGGILKKGPSTVEKHVRWELPSLESAPRATTTDFLKSRQRDCQGERRCSNLGQQSGNMEPEEVLHTSTGLALSSPL